MRVLKPKLMWLENVETSPLELYADLAQQLDLEMGGGIDNPVDKSWPGRRPRLLAKLTCMKHCVYFVT